MMAFSGHRPRSSRYDRLRASASIKKPSVSAVAILMCFGATVANAGILVNGNWVPADCGVKPVVPSINDKDVEAYNKSVAEIKDWQQKATAYYDCLIKEANADNAVIADTANRERARFSEALGKIGAAVEAAKKNLDGR